MSYYKGIFKDTSAWLAKRAADARAKMGKALEEQDLREASRQESRLMGFEFDYSEGDRPRILG